MKILSRIPLAQRARLAIRIASAFLLFSFAASQQVLASVTYKQSNSAVQTSGSSITVVLTSAQNAGDLNVVFIGWQDTTSYITSMTDSSGNTYVFANQSTYSTTAQQQVWFARNIAAAGAGDNTLTITFNDSVGWADVRIGEYSGVDPHHPLDVVVGGGAKATLTTSGSIETTNADDLLVGSDYANDGTTGPGSGYTEREYSGYMDILEDETVSSTGDYSATAPQGGDTWYVMQMIALRAAGSPTGLPYAWSPVVSQITWNESLKQRYAQNASPYGSDLWTSMWASDGNVYGAFGDGYGFSGTTQCAYVQIGIGQMTGTPDTSLGLSNVFCGASRVTNECADNSNPMAGKDDGVVALTGSVMYLFNTCGSDNGSTDAWLARSTNNGTSWTTPVGNFSWPDANGYYFAGFIGYGEAEAGTLAPDSTGTQYLYVYGFNINSPTNNAYLARVPASPTNDLETASNWSYFSGLDSSGNPTWASSSSSAVAVFTDSNNLQYGISGAFDAALGRYIMAGDHGVACGGTPAQPCARQVSMFDAPSPWGPWTVFDYEEQFDNYYCGTNCLANLVGVSFGYVQKWMSTDGVSLWAEYSAADSSNDGYDSLNLLKGTMALASGSTVNGISISTQTPAVVDFLSLSNSGNLEYIDRTYRLTAIPSAYIGLEMIRLAENDKTNNSSTYLQFTTTVSQNVCVAWDSHQTVPSWLSSWTSTGNSLTGVAYYGTATFNVYKKSFSAGTVTLNGPNTNDNYMVFVGC
jgi:hypothetical protein